MKVSTMRAASSRSGLADAQLAAWLLLGGSLLASCASDPHESVMRGAGHSGATSAGGNAQADASNDGGTAGRDAAASAMDASARTCESMHMTLPPPPTVDRTQARFWFTIPDAAEYAAHGLSVREQIFIATRAQLLRLDWTQRTLCLLPASRSADLLLLDMLAPRDTSHVVALFGTRDGERTIRVSIDGGDSWRDATLPSPPEYQGSVPSALVGLRGQGAKPGRLFATFGGPTLDVSDDGGLTWTRQIKGGSAIAQGFVVDTAEQTLWHIAEERVDRVTASRLALAGSGALANMWSLYPLTEWDANGVYVAVADPHAPSGIYLGGEGRLGYLEQEADGTPRVSVPWALSPTSSGDAPYTYVRALWADPGTKGHVVFGGGQQGSSAASLLRSTASGGSPTPIAFDDAPAGTVRSIELAPDQQTLMVVVDARVYLLAR